MATAEKIKLIREKRVLCKGEAEEIIYIHPDTGEQYMSKSRYKEFLRSSQPDLEDVESFDDWFDCIMEAHESDKLVLSIGNRTYINIEK